MIFDHLNPTEVAVDFGALSHNIPGSLLDNPGKFDRCVKSVAGKGKVGNAYAVCNASVGGSAKSKGMKKSY